jgi:hypothetical protein
MNACDLHRISFLTYCRAIPHLHEQFLTRIPPEYWALDEDTARVSCPCGHAPRAPYAIPTACQCGRWFLYDGRGVRVARPATRA